LPVTAGDSPQLIIMNLVSSHPLSFVFSCQAIINHGLLPFLLSLLIQNHKESI